MGLPTQRCFAAVRERHDVFFGALRYGFASSTASPRRAGLSLVTARLLPESCSSSTVHEAPTRSMRLLALPVALEAMI